MYSKLKFILHATALLPKHMHHAKDRDTLIEQSFIYLFASISKSMALPYEKLTNKSLNGK